MIGSRSTGSVLQVRVTLEGIDPPIWRRLLIEPARTLHGLHRMIQMLFGWYDYHLYRFEVGERAFELPDEESEGEDPSRARLDRLGLGPGDTFRYIYDFGDDWHHLVEVEPAPQHADPGWLPWVLDGARRGPPEDCGGPYAYADIQELLRRPPGDLDDNDRETLEWLGPDFDPEEFSLTQARHDLLLASAWGVLRRKR